MTNLEYMVKYYPDLLIALATNSGQKLAINISSSDGKEKICECSDINCSDCKFNISSRSCEDLGEEWFKEEYKGIIESSDNDEGGISW